MAIFSLTEHESVRKAIDSRKMRPGAPDDDVADRLLSTAKLTRKRSIANTPCGVLSPNGQNVGGAELGQALPFPSGSALGVEVSRIAFAPSPSFRDMSGSMLIAGQQASLGTRIADVVLLRSEEEMVGINTVPDVTAVTNEEAGRNCAKVQLPGEPMNANGGALVKADLCVTRVKEKACPEPTGRSLLDLCPEAFLSRAASRSGIAPRLAAFRQP